VLGLISTRWRQEADGLALDLTVPPNAVAEVRLPAPSAGAVREGGRPIGRVAGVRALGAGDGRAAFEVGSGSYKFRVAG
jgi:alpha-L-rhamnosidase